MEDLNPAVGGLSYQRGKLPETAALAAAYVPIQPEGSPKYPDAEALANGTLFPGLDLPWMNAVNTPTNLSGTPLGELMALSFVTHELGLYLDTHPEDREALVLYTEYQKLLEAGEKTYVQRCGPLTQGQVNTAGYSWLDDPWPWDFRTCCLLPEGGQS